MDQDNNFRFAMLAILIIILPIGAYHRFRAASGEPIPHAPEGWVLFAAIRLGGLVMALATGAFLINPAWMRWSSVPLPPAVRWAGVALNLAVVPLFFWTLNALGKNLTDTVVTRINHTLVTSGPYQFVRHPFYVCALLLVIGTTLVTGNVIIGLSGLTVFCLLAIRCRREEAKLVERFGDDYRNYMARTNRFFPRFRTG